MSQKTYTCGDALERLYSYADGVLTEPARSSMEAHLRSCPRCRAELDDIRSFESVLKNAYRNAATPHADLWARIRATVAQTGTARANSGFAWWRGWIRLASVAAAAAFVAIAITIYEYRVVEINTSEASLVAAPAQDLRVFVESRRPMDVATFDAEELQRWFRGKFEFPLPKFNTDTESRLVGGRLCYFLNRRIASLLYRVDGQLISLYVIPERQITLKTQTAPAIAGQRALLREDKGYSQVMWQTDNVVYALVGELPLRRLVDLSAEFMRARHPSAAADGRIPASASLRPAATMRHAR